MAAAGISDVQSSMSGGHNQNLVSNNEIEMSALAMADAVQPESDYVIYKLVDTKRNAPVNIDGCDDVINPITGKVERIWLLSGATSIWSSELTEVLKDKDYMRQNRRSLRFESKVLRIPRWDTCAIEFAEVCRHNIGNKNRKTGSKMEFFEYDSLKQSKAALEKEFLEIDMAIKAKEQPEAAMFKHASFLGIQMVDDLGRPKVADAVRREYMLAAKRNPKLFQDTLESKAVEVTYMVKKAILDAKIEIGANNNNAYFTAGGGQICQIPTSQNAIKYLTEFALTNSSEGKEFLENLKRL